MAIKVSSSTLVERLIADLTRGRTAAREAAVARLILVGPRAVERLIGVAASGDASTDARTAALRALEAVGDARALEPALDLLSDRSLDPALTVAAAAVARVFVGGRRSAAAVDRLTVVTLDRARPDAVRLAALRALRELKPKTIAPLLASLAGDPSAAIRAEAAPAKPGRAAARDPLALLTDAAAQGLNDETLDGQAVSRALNEAGESAPLPLLHRLVERLRERESNEPAARRADWTAARAAAHVALAARGSRLGLYDLRETLQGAGPLPREFITAASMAGDASCLEAIAAGCSKTKQPAWRAELATAFQAIVAREKLTRRHGAVRKLTRRYAAALDEMWPR